MKRACLILFLTAAVQTQASDVCEKTTEPKAISKNFGGSPSVEFAGYKFVIGGEEEEFVGTIDRHAVRVRIAGCMQGTVRCFKNLDSQSRTGKLIFSFSLTQQKKIRPPEISNLKIESKDFSLGQISQCLQEYWSQIDYPTLPREKMTAEVRIPVRMTLNPKK